MSKLSKIIIILSILNTIFLVSGVHARELVINTETPNKLYLTNYFSFFETKNKELRIEDVLKHLFVPFDFNRSFNFDKDKSFWFHVKIKNLSARTAYVLESAKPGVDEITIFQFHENKIIKELTAYKNLIAETSSLSAPLIHFDLNFEQNETYDLYIKVSSNNRISERFLLYERGKYYQDTLTKIHIAGIFYGIFGIILIITISMALITKQLSFFLYSLFITIIAIIVAGEMGHLNYFFSNSFVNTAIIIDFLKPLALLLFLAFSKYYLKVKEYFPKLNLVLITSLVTLSLLYISLLIFQFSWILDLINFLIVIFLAMCIGIAIIRSFSKDIPAIFFVGSWTMFAAGQLSWLATFYYIFDPQTSYNNVFLLYGALWGALLEMTMMSIGLGFRTLHNFTMAQQGQDTKNLLRVISHDIATPLSIVQGTAKIQLRKPEMLDEKALKAWHTINRASENMTRILEHVRTQDALLSGKMNLSLEMVDLQSSTLEIEPLFQERLNDKKIKLTNNVPPNLMILAHKHALTFEVIANLVSNAIKFTPENREIVLNAFKSKDKIILEIINFGTLIPTKTIPDLFSPYISTTTVGTNGERGTGFGLPLVKAYIDLFKAKIEVSSISINENTAKTTFRIIFSCIK